MSVPDERTGADGPPLASVSALHRQTEFTRWFGWHLAAALLVFFASAYTGYAVLGALPVERLTDVAPGDSPLPEFDFVSITLNNLRALLLMGLGAITGGLLSAFGLAVNGALVGAVVAVVVERTSWAVILAALVPHGVAELSAFFAAAAVGFRVPHRLLRWLLGYDETPLTAVEAYELAVLAVVLALVIVVAAWIEVNVTPEVIRAVGGPDALEGGAVGP